MTDPLLPEREISESAAARLAALRQPSTSKKRIKPAHTSKVLAAGISTTALFGMVAAMGWQTGTSSAQSAEPPVATATTQVAAPPTPVTPTVAPLVPTAPTTAVPAAPAPVATAPAATMPVIQVPAAIPAVQVNPGQSNTTTKSSG